VLVCSIGETVSSLTTVPTSQHTQVCGAVRCSVVQCGAVQCSVLQRVAAFCSTLQCAAVCCSVLQCDAVCCSVLQPRRLQWCLHL